MNLRNYVVITGAYWGFTLTDGALRMLVLLHFFHLGYSPVQLAFLFLFYEFFGIVTNLLGGWLGSRTGLRVTLIGGLFLQVASLGLLALLNPTWPEALSVTYVMVMQSLSGIAKDLTKMSAKSSIRVLVPRDTDGTLFKWVSMLTGSKNALKGAGFFLGGLLLSVEGYAGALWTMAGVLLGVSLGAWLALPPDLGQAKTKVGFRQLFSKEPEINVLSAARFFLFGARDIWFVVGVPIFLEGTLEWTFSQVGSFMALWVIGYGIVQSAAPAVLRGRNPTGVTAAWTACVLSGVAAAVPLSLSAGVPARTAIIAGLALFGVVFAVNSAVHSYLILDYTDGDKVALNVGFYYMANAGGRLIGCLLSGVLFQLSGLAGCLWGTFGFSLAAALVALRLPRGALHPERLAHAAISAGDGD
ncbi:MAG TPA: organoarsenical effux MFS transporter ArsJ [Opitutaceae bacterium]|nr:organoarsenical effux MFS transporter ArsJ [Opitutaceae bacterium]